MPDLDTHYPVVVIGGGQAGLAMSAQLTAQGIEHVVLEKNTIAAFLEDAALGRVLPGHAELAVPASRLSLRRPVIRMVSCCGTRSSLTSRISPGTSMRRSTKVSPSHASGKLAAVSCSRRQPARSLLISVVLAVSGYHVPKVPPFADRLDPSITQFHSSAYRNPDQLPPGECSWLGAGNRAARSPRTCIWPAARCISLSAARRGARASIAAVT